MLIPVGGPIAAIPVTGSATGALMTALSGVIQLGGLSMGVAGAVLLARSNREANVAVLVAPEPDGVALRIGGRF
jgi:hypothetical protein